MWVMDVTSTSVRAAVLASPGAGGQAWELETETTVPLPRAAGPSGVGEAASLALDVLARSAGGLPGQGALVTGLGGGMVVAVGGVMTRISADTARRTALTSGATVARQLAIDDGLAAHEKRAALRSRPLDALLLAGGVGEEIGKGGGGRQVAYIARVLAPALPRPRWNALDPLPVIFAGSEEFRGEVASAFEDATEGGRALLSFAPNVRPVMPVENHEPSRRALLSIFREKVLVSCPAYAPALKAGIVPEGGSPAEARAWPAGYVLGAVARARSDGDNVLLVDLGRDAVEVHSVVGGVANRTRTDMAGRDWPADRWLPLAPGSDDWACRLGWRLAHPGRMAETWEETFADGALTRAATAQALADHRHVAIELYGLQRQRVGEVFRYVSGVGGESLIRMESISRVLVSGEELAAGHMTPLQAVLAVVDGFEPVGLTLLEVDVPGRLRLLAACDLASGHPPRVGFTPLALCVSPLRAAPVLGGRALARVTISGENAQVNGIVRSGALERLDLTPGRPVSVTVHPRGSLDFGAGPGRRVTLDLPRGVASVFLDGRGRPVPTARDPARRSSRMAAWLATVYGNPADWVSGAAAEAGPGGSLSTSKEGGY